MAQEDFMWASKIEGRTLKGNKAQGSIEPSGDGNIGTGKRTSRWSKALWSGASPLETVVVNNGGRATAAVTQCGCREGKRFEGYDRRA